MKKVGKGVTGNKLGTREDKHKEGRRMWEKIEGSVEGGKGKKCIRKEGRQEGW